MSSKSPIKVEKNRTSSQSLSYLKINFTESQFKVYEHKSKKVNSFFSDNGFVFNEPEFFKVMALNFDNPDFMRVMLDLYVADASKLFRKDI